MDEFFFLLYLFSTSFYLSAVSGLRLPDIIVLLYQSKPLETSGPIQLAYELITLKQYVCNFC